MQPFVCAHARAPAVLPLRRPSRTLGIKAIAQAKKNGGTGAGGSKGFNPGKQSPQKKAKPLELLTEPMVITQLEGLTGAEAMPEPRWDTFCNHLQGEWVGHYAAYTPWEGMPEPVWVDSNNKYLNQAYTRIVEQRQPRSDAPGDLLVRRIGRAAAPELLQELKVLDAGDGEEGSVEGDASSSGSGAGRTGKDVIDVEGFGCNDNGVIIFDGGSYSAGPEFIGSQQMRMLSFDAQRDIDELDAADPDQAPSAGGRSEAEGDEDEDARTISPGTISDVEQCLAYSSGMRMRLKVTAKFGTAPDGELDVEVKRVVLYKEHWYGQAGLQRLDFKDSHNLGTSCTKLPRPQPAQLEGDWDVFTACAVPVEEEDPDTLQQRLVWVYSSREQRQRWRRGGSRLMDGGDGISLWLPNNVVCTIKTVPAAAAAAAAAAGAASSVGTGAPGQAQVSLDASGHSAGGAAVQGAPRGLVFSFWWLVEGGTAMLAEREYDGSGHLVEVRHGTAVKGGWSGGKM